MHRVRCLVLLASVLLGAAVLFAPAAGATSLSVSERQAAPGVTQRTIWGEAQVAVYRLPTAVTHTGYIHVELIYKPAGHDLVVFLLDGEANVCETTREQGQLGTWAGREIVDYYVPAVDDTTVTPEGVDPIRGDTYYILVQALNGTRSYRLRGYYPRMRAGGLDLDTTSPRTLTRGTITVPARPTSWNSLSGAPYGGPFDVKPTSQGVLEVRLEYPVVAGEKPASPLPAPTSMSAAFDQYVATADWTRWPVADRGDADLSHWDLLGLNRHESGEPAWDGAWYGLDDFMTLQWGDSFTPVTGTYPTYHFTPTLWMVASDPALGAASPPATGKRTKGYKATLLIPQHLYLKSAPSKVRKRGRAVLKGTLALPVTPGPAAVVEWAAAGTPVRVEVKRGSAWTRVKTVRTGARGVWSATLRPSATLDWRVRWLGLWQARVSAAADDEEPQPVWVRDGDTMSVNETPLRLAITPGGVTFELVTGAFSDGTSSVTVADGAVVTKALAGVTCSFGVVKGTVRRGDEASVPRRIVVK